jgi:hypothetical protein
MDDPVTRHGMANVLCPLVIALAAHGAAAADLPDPTRPAITQAGTDAAGRAAGELVLQSVLVSAERSVAVISGQVVPLGGQVDGWRLVRLTATRAWLRGPDGERSLALYDLGIRDATVKSVPGMPLKRVKNSKTHGT